MSKTLDFIPLLTKPACDTSKYGTNGFATSAIASWIFFQNNLPNNNLRQIKCSLRITFSIPTTKFLFKNIDGSFVSDYFVNTNNVARLF